MEPTVTDQTAEELADLHEQLGPYESVNDAIAAAVAAEREAIAQLVGREASILEQHGDDVARFATAPTLRGCEAAIRNRGEAT